MRPEGCDVRIVKPLGRDGRGLVWLPRALGQSRQDAGRICRLPADANDRRLEQFDRFGCLSSQPYRGITLSQLVGLALGIPPDALNIDRHILSAGARAFASAGAGPA